MAVLAVAVALTVLMDKRVELELLDKVTMAALLFGMALTDTALVAAVVKALLALLGVTQV
jgi:hypothetical protein